MKHPVFKGSCTAVITPFSADGIDLEQMGKLLDFQAENGTKAIVVAGTTGENATLEQREYERLVEYCIRRTEGRMKVIVGVGGNNTAHCLEKAKFAQFAGADAVLMTTPYYNKTTQRGLVAHFSRVAEAAEIPLILYNVPSRTAIGISAETYKTLSQHPNINGTKEASGDFSLIGRIAAECGSDLFIWSGNDDQTVPMMALGALGVISVLSNVLPSVTARLCELCLQGDFSSAAALSAKYEALTRSLFLETNPIPVKAAMQLLGLDSGTLRLPLVPMSSENLVKLRSAMEKTGLI